MRKILIGLLLLIASFALPAATLPESNISYVIDARLDPVTRNLDGKETITWRNTLDAPVDSIPMHLYLNAFSNRGSS